MRGADFADPQKNFDCAIKSISKGAKNECAKYSGNRDQFYRCLQLRHARGPKNLDSLMDSDDSYPVAISSIWKKNFS